jgi:predicted transcriptional regulator|tara:strand:+ start:20144 stop:20734 length:591 start_codon:yes stop_codon:yes gene_type:complete
MTEIPSWEVQIPKRKRGRPKSTERVVTPEVLEKIGRLWCRGWTYRAIAAEIGVVQSTVIHHMNTTIKPQWKSDLNSDMQNELAKLAEVERVAWACFEASRGDETKEIVKDRLVEETGNLELAERVTSKLKREGSAAWMGVIQWCLDFRAKLMGSYAPTKVEVEGLRVAGSDASEIDKKMMGRLAELMAERSKPSSN